jgi:diaminohydroxyphosphoribosylaminopyrimidine deaminase/5-amino-6-(5-phosphoribosylamino)uracil reductase
MNFELKSALKAAIEKAQQFIGATSPNPPVGAAAVDSQGRILSVQAHERAGTGHAEARVIADLRERGLLGQAHTLVVTLEPCNHHGRTPPCSQAILDAGIRHVVYGVPDPNPRVAGHGAERLRQAGVDARECSDPGLRAECEALICSFSHWARTGYPWVVVKTAHLPDGSMIPPPGQKTFTSPESLKVAHEFRRRADALITGSGTVIADWPEFTVRHVPDHPLVSSGQKKRWLVVLDRRRRTPREWVEQAQARGFEVLLREELQTTLQELGKSGALEILVEAGPELSSAFLKSSLWNQHVLITQGNPDTVRIEQNVHWNHPKTG